MAIRGEPYTVRVVLFDIGGTTLRVRSSVGEVYAPVAGTVVEANAALVAAPELINNEPYDGGWIVVLQADDLSALDNLLDPAAYAEMTG